MSVDHKSIFETVYISGDWGTNNDELYKGSSGGGSSIEFNERYIQFLRAFLRQQKIETVLDLGCGDFRCGPSLYSDFNGRYYGYDVYHDLIERHKKVFSNEPKYQFKCVDILDQREVLPEADLVILKDILQHWSNKEVVTMLDHLASCKKYKYILITNCCEGSFHGYDTITGKHRPLSASFLPLRKYMPIVCLTYNRKETSVIYCS